MSDNRDIDTRQTILITGCSDGGLGAALAVAFHEAGLHVYATARNPLKMSELKSRGIETLALDVTSEASISTCVSKISHLDILVNNAGAIYSMPISDLNISEAKQLFDLNVFSYLALTQAFLPLLLKSKGIIVNQTSTAALLTIPFQATYNASKAAMVMFSDTMRVELAPFGIRVVDLKTSSVVSNNFKNQLDTGRGVLPKGSLYEPAKDTVERTLRGDFAPAHVSAEQWAQTVAGEVLKKNPPANVWAGTNSWAAKLFSWTPFKGMLEGMVRKMTGMEVVERTLQG